MITPQIGERTARRQVAAARGSLTRALNRDDAAAVERAEHKLEAAIRRLAAIESQVPERHMRAWEEGTC